MSKSKPSVKKVLWNRNKVLWTGFRIRIRINLSCWIQIRIQIADPDPDPGGQKCPTKIEKVQNFHVLKCWMFFFEC
jgi:hypothetical protein